MGWWARGAAGAWFTLLGCVPELRIVRSDAATDVVSDGAVSDVSVDAPTDAVVVDAAVDAAMVDDARDASVDAATCATGLTSCGGECIDTQRDPRHCGRCASVCAAANATASCTAGMCGYGTCNPGFADCDGMTSTGCEVDLRNSADNCGSCGNVCRYAHGTPRCAGGTCAIAECATGWSNCDGSTTNGCETNTRTATAHCGMCGHACTSTQSCVAGVCTWRSPAQIPTGRFGHAAVTGADGKIYVWGGRTTTALLSSLEVFDPATNTWSARAPMPVATTFMAGAALQDGRILSIGGYRFEGGDVGSVYLYDPVANSWTTLSSIAPRSDAIAVTLQDGRVFLAAGAGLQSSSTALFDPSTMMWSSGTPLPTARELPQVAMSADGRVYVFGGSDGVSTYYDTVDVFDPTTRLWGAGPTMPSARAGGGAVRGADLRIYLVGGLGETSRLSTVWALSSSGPPYVTLASLGLPRSRLGLAPLGDGRILLVGGTGDSSAVLSSTLVYDPADENWH